jgi:hypothetical protein
MKTLYVIGNGFDIYHQIKSNYKFFKKYLEKENEDLLEVISKYYDTSDDSLLWWQFENALKDFDPSELEEQFSEYMPNYASDDFRDRDRYDLQIFIEQELEPLKEDLQSAFNNWILSLKQPNIIPKIGFEKDAVFLTFNYTDTLERIYKIKPDHILYIHNKSQQKGNDLIFGHSWHPTEWAKQREEQMPEGLSELEEDEWIQEQSDNYDYSIMRGYEAIDSFFSSIYKDSKTIIDTHKAFFSSLSNVEIINIIGHSLSIVDKPYFEEIAKYINKGEVIWKVTYHEDKDAVNHTQFIESLGIEKKLIETYRLPEIIKPIQSKLF